MNDKKIIMAGLANNKTSLGEVFRRYVDCFKTFSKPDVFDLQPFTKNKEFKLDIFPQYNGPIDHDVKYFHSTFNLYRAIKNKTKPIQRDSNVKKIGYFVWESSELYSQDAEVLKDFDEIWTASHYCRDIFSQYVDSSLVKVIPHPIPIPDKLPKKYKNFTILIIGNISSNVDRKNISANLEVAKIIKQKHKDVNVIFKTITGSDSERTLLKQIVGNSKIKVIDEYYSSEKVQDLIGKCHVVLSLHRSEGFGLTLAEAMAVNTIPIATGYSGNIDFMKDVDFLVDYKLVDVSVPFFKGQWAEPDKDDAIDKIENILNKKLDFDYKNFKNYIYDQSSIATQIRKTLDIKKLEDKYPEISPKICIEYATSDHLSKCKKIISEKKLDINLDFMFKIKDIIKPIKGYNSDKLVSTSLFYKDGSFPQKAVKNIKNSKIELFNIEDLNIKNLTAKLKKCDKTFFEVYVNNFFNKSLLDNNKDWDFRVYLANDLQCLIPFFKELNVEIVLMEHNSDYHNPGALWRYLPMTPTISNHETVFIRDTDSRFLTDSLLYKTLLQNLKHPDISMSRILQKINNNDEMALILGYGFMFNPYKLSIDVEKLMTGYIHFNIENEVLHRGKYPNYGFDENFLKHVIYWMVTKAGGMATIVPKSYTSFDYIQELDLFNQRQNNCIVINL